MRSATEKREFEQLARLAAAGDRPAFRKVVELSHHTVFRLALRLLGDKASAEDVVQETYIRAWQGLAKLRDPGAAYGWICKIARNVATDRHRSVVRHPQRSLDAPVGRGTGRLPLVEHLPSGDAGPEKKVDDSEVTLAVRAAMAELNEKHRVVLELREMDGMSYEEIAEALGIRIGTVESRIHRARQALAKKLRAFVRERAEGSQ